MAVTLAWQNRAACQGMDRETFFLQSQESEAVATCRQCRVQHECLEWAMERERGLCASHRAGIWGGVTGPQRWRLERCRIGRCTCGAGRHIGQPEKGETS